MKILLITDEEWNDYTFANGVLTNWFTGMDVELAQIYTSPGLPINGVCNLYYQITDGQMAKSIISCRKSGGRVERVTKPANIEVAKQNARRKGVYSFMKKISLKWNAPVQFVRDFIWLNGRYDIDGLRSFVQDFRPDIVFCPRFITPKLMRLEKLVSSITTAPFVAFTADDEASVPNYGSWLSKLRRKSIHKKFSKHISLYSHYFTFSEDQAMEYREEYGITSSTLLKCGVFADSFTPKEVGYPIRLVYAGRLYCNRWVSLAEIGKALQVINKDGIKMVLDIYTQEKLTDEQREALSEDKFIYMKGSVTPAELAKVYEKADIALHVESMDEYYRMVTRVSFSTKIIDLMASTCAILAICWEKHAGYQYLKENDAAFCCSDYQSILPQLQEICDNHSLITEYQQKAYDCGVKNHSREVIQNKILDVFEKAISQNNRFHE